MAAPSEPPTVLPVPATLTYYEGTDRREAMWRIAPRRCMWLAAAWAAAIVALFLPGCDMSSSANGSEAAPTYVAYGLSFVQVRESVDAVRGIAAGNGSSIPGVDGYAMSLACALFLAGSAVFLLTPLLLRRRLRRGLGWLGWTVSGLLLSPWAMLIVGGATGTGKHYLYGYYVLASAHTAAFVVLMVGSPAPRGRPGA